MRSTARSSKRRARRGGCSRCAEPLRLLPLSLHDAKNTTADIGLRHAQTLEEQNADLLDKYAALEDEHSKVSSFKPLVESYKAKLDALEVQASTSAREATALRVELDRTKEKLAAAEEGRAADREALLLNEERVKELELGQGAKKGKGRSNGQDEEEDDDDEAGGVGDELDDALSGTTTTDLKLQVRRLKRELARAKGDKADSSRLVVLESLLDDANRMKKRYEGDYLKEHRDKLVLAARLEEIMSGRSRYGDGCVCPAGASLASPG